MRSSVVREIVALAAAAVLVMAVPIGGLALVAWWLETRFNATVALVGVVGLLLVAAFVLGAWFNHRSSKRVLDHAADFLHDATAAYRAVTNVQREHVRLERDAFNRRARLEEIDLQRVRRLADQQARLLVETERERWEAQQGPTWIREAREEGDAQYYE